MSHRLLRTLSLAILLSSLVPGAIRAADEPGTCAGVSAASVQNTWLRGAIASAGDEDWFRFNLAASGRVQVALGDLPADYRLDLYGACTTLVASSQQPGRWFEEVTPWLAAGTYRVRVSGVAGASSATTYGLRFRPLAAGVVVLSQTAWTDGDDRLHIAGEVLNNTPERRRWIEIRASLRDSTGAIRALAVGYAEAWMLQPLGRSPFEIVARRPAGYQYASLSVVSRITTSGSMTGLTAVNARPYIDASGIRHDPGTVRNGGTVASGLTEVLVSYYDALGNVKHVASTWTSPQAVAAGGSATYDVRQSRYPSPNRVVHRVQAVSNRCAANRPVSNAATHAVYRTIPNAGATVALTFDMGGRIEPALRIVQLLVAERVCATFFPTGAMAGTTEGRKVMDLIEAHPEFFEIGSHTMHHCNLAAGGGGSPTTAPCPTSPPSSSFIRQELTDADAVFRATAGTDGVPFWRPPYGAYNGTVLDAAASVGYTKTFMWDVDTIDWRPISEGGPTAESMARKVVDNAVGGSDVLMHLGGFETLDALPAMIDGLRGRGFQLTTLSDMLEH